MGSIVQYLFNQGIEILKMIFFYNKEHYHRGMSLKYYPQAACLEISYKRNEHLSVHDCNSDLDIFDL